jgi:hypothetical protein
MTTSSIRPLVDRAHAKPGAALLAVVALVVGLAACGQRGDEAAVGDAPPGVVATSTRPDMSATTIRADPTTVPPASTMPMPGDISILFIGNSHTSTHDIPGMVKALLESSSTHEVEVARLGADFLRTGRESSSITEAVASGEWDIVILQGQEISQSHTISYSTAGAVGLASLASQAGARPLFFSEWKRQGIDETEYIEDIYRGIAEQASAEVIPVGRAWDRVLADDPAAALWSRDGNHSSPEGAFLAAATIAYFIAGPDADLRTDSALEQLLTAAQLTIEDYLGE